MQDEFIKVLAHEMITQDNLATAHPLYCVYEKKKIYGMTESHADGFIWTREGEEIDQSEIEFDVDGDPKVEFTKLFFKEINSFVNAHFTMKAAKKFVAENNHNFPDTFVYVTSLQRCNEMIQLQEWIKNQAEIK